MGDTCGGAAPTVRSVVDKPISLWWVLAKTDAIDLFHPVSDGRQDIG